MDYFEELKDFGVKNGDIICHEPRQNLTRREAIAELAGGSVGGILGRLVEYPFDTVKVQQQLHGTGGSSWQTFKNLVSNGGVRNLYRGVAAPMCCSVVESAVCFPVFGMTRRFLQGKKSEDQPLTFAEAFLCGATAGVVVSHILTPIELIKCRMQAGALSNDPRFPVYKNSWQCFTKALKNGGIRQLYRGHLPTLAREICGNAAMYSSYEMISQRTSNSNYMSLLFAGGVGGMLYWLVPFPIDTIKSRIQTYSGPEANQPTFRSTAKDLFAKKMLFRGLGVTMLRAAPGTAVVFLTVEEFKRVFL